MLVPVIYSDEDYHFFLNSLLLRFREHLVDQQLSSTRFVSFPPLLVSHPSDDVDVVVSRDRSVLKVRRELGEIRAEDCRIRWWRRRRRRRRRRRSGNCWECYTSGRSIATIGKGRRTRVSSRSRWKSLLSCHGGRSKGRRHDSLMTTETGRSGKGTSSSKREVELCVAREENCDSTWRQRFAYFSKMISSPFSPTRIEERMRTSQHLG